MLNQRLISQKESREEPKPIFFDLQQSQDQTRLEALLEEKSHIKVIDTYETQLQELFVLNNPPLYLDKEKLAQEFKQYRDTHYGSGEAWQAGKWVYLPWRHIVLHILDDEGFQQVRTGRNRNLITAEEQAKYYQSTIGIAGLSVGNSIALAIVLTGGGKHLKLADPDTLELTNLNRIRGSIAELTEPKVYMTARQIYELDPYADLTLYTEGLTEANSDEFFTGLDVIIDEIDNLEMKIKLRDQARKYKVPLVTAVDNGDSGITDVERYDLKPDLPYFNGRAGEDIAEKVVGQNLPTPVLGKLIGEKIVGFDVTEPKMQNSLLEIGHSIPTWPQLGGAAVLNGVVVAMAVRRLLTGEPVIDGRANVSLPHFLIPGYDSREAVAEREKNTEDFARELDKRLQSFQDSSSSSAEAE